MYKKFIIDNFKENDLFSKLKKQHILEYAYFYYKNNLCRYDNDSINLKYLKIKHQLWFINKQIITSFINTMQEPDFFIDKKKYKATYPQINYLFELLLKDKDKFWDLFKRMFNCLIIVKKFKYLANIENLTENDALNLLKINNDSITKIRDLFFNLYDICFFDGNIYKLENINDVVFEVFDNKGFIENISNSNFIIIFNYFLIDTINRKIFYTLQKTQRLEEQCKMITLALNSFHYDRHMWSSLGLSFNSFNILSNISWGELNKELLKLDKF